MDFTKCQITKIAREANKLTIQTIKEKDIGNRTFALIYLVVHNLRISQKDVGHKLNMDKGSVDRRIVNLEHKAYVVRRKNFAVARDRFLYITPKIDSLKNSKTAMDPPFYTWLSKELSNEERDTFCTLLKQLYYRSKMERRSRFAHLYKKLNHAEVYLYEES